MAEMQWERVGRGRMPLIGWVLLFAVNMIPSLRLSIGDIVWLGPNYVSRAGMLWGRDFSNHWLAGTLALQGLNVYDHAAYQEAIARFGASAFQNYSYPPHTLIVGAALSFLPYPIALIFWAIGCSALFYLAARPIVPFNPLYVLIVPSVARLPYGQFGLLTSALFLWSMRGSGFAAGLLTMKPHLGLLLAAVMAAKKRYRQISVAIVVMIVLLATSEALFGLGRSFVSQGMPMQMAVLQTSYDAGYFSVMPTAYVALRHTGLEWIGQCIAAAAALVMLWQFRRASMRDLVFPVATATFIVLPYSFAYDMALVSVGFAIILYCNWKDLRWVERAVAILAFSSPNLAFTHMVPLILMAGLWLQFIVWRREQSIIGPQGADGVIDTLSTTAMSSM